MATDAGADGMSLADVAGSWHDLFVLVGTAAATLVGLLFVAASVGAGFFTHERHTALRAFLSPSVVHFTCVLTACFVAVAPIRDWTVLGALILAVGLFGGRLCRVGLGSAWCGTDSRRRSIWRTGCGTRRCRPSPTR